MGGCAEDNDFGKISHSRKIGNCKMAIFLLSFFFSSQHSPRALVFPLLSSLLLPLASSNAISMFTHAVMTAKQIWANKKTFLHKKKNQLPQDWLSAPTRPPFHCFGTPTWLSWRHVKMLSRFLWILYSCSIPLSSHNFLSRIIKMCYSSL